MPARFENRKGISEEDIPGRVDRDVLGLADGRRQCWAIDGQYAADSQRRDHIGRRLCHSCRCTYCSEQTNGLVDHTGHFLSRTEISFLLSASTRNLTGTCFRKFVHSNERRVGWRDS